MIRIFVLQIEEHERSPEFQEELFRYLPESGKLRVKDRLSDTSRLHTIVGELLARYSVAQYLQNPETSIDLQFGENGKPHIENIPDVHFNISHSGHYVVCAVASTEIGIDVERSRKVNLRIAERFFSPSEIHDLMQLHEAEQMQYFITLWTIKESYLKAIGKGLTQHLNSFTIIKSGGSFRLTGSEKAEQYGIVTFQLDQSYQMALCAPLPFETEPIDHIFLKEIIKSSPKYI